MNQVQEFYLQKKLAPLQLPVAVIVIFMFQVGFNLHGSWVTHDKYGGVYNNGMCEAYFRMYVNKIKQGVYINIRNPKQPFH